jgi:hypothetical protein
MVNNKKPSTDTHQETVHDGNSGPSCMLISLPVSDAEKLVSLTSAAQYVHKIY